MWSKYTHIYLVEFYLKFFNKKSSSRMYLLFCIYQFIGPFLFNLLLVFVRFLSCSKFSGTSAERIWNQTNHEIPYNAVDWGPSWPMTMISCTLLDCGTSLTGRSLLFRPCLDLIPLVTADVWPVSNTTLEMVWSLFVWK